MGSTNDDPFLEAHNLCNHILFSMIFKAAIELNIFDIISRQGHGAYVSPSYIASQLPTQNHEATASRLDRMLRLLVSHSLLTCSQQTLKDGSVERLYALTPTSKFFAGDEASLASAVCFGMHKANLDVWSQAKDFILEGGDQFKKVHDMSVFEYMGKDPTYNNTFNQAMADHTAMAMKEVLEIYKGFEGVDSLVDVAGGTGKCLHMIVSKYPSIKAINFDLPHVIHTAPSYPGIQHVGGDMFSDSDIPRADAIMIKETLHNWDDEHCIKVLKNCYKVLPSKGKVIVINLIMPEVPEPTGVSQYVSKLDNAMLLSLQGKERTQKEYVALCNNSGFFKFEVACFAHSLWGVMEFTK